MNKEELKNWITENLFNSKGNLNANKFRADYKFYNENICTFNLIDNIVKGESTLSNKCLLLLEDIYTVPGSFKINNISKEELKEWINLNLFDSRGRINANLLRPDYKFYNDNKNIFDIIDETVQVECRLGQKCILFLKDIYTAPECPECGSPVNLNGHEFLTFCSNKCAQKSEETKLKRSDSVHQSYVDRGDEIVSQRKATKLERYGDENYVNSEKAVETWNNRPEEFKDEVKQRRKETWDSKPQEEKTAIKRKALETFKSKGIEAKIKRYNQMIDTQINDIDADGLNTFQRNALISVPKRLKTMSIIGDDGLTGFERTGRKTALTQTTVILDNGFTIAQNIASKRAKKGFEKRVKEGKAIPIDMRDDKEIYYHKVWVATERVYKKYKFIINPNNVKRGINTYHLDHNISIKHGFLNNIPIYMIAHPCNLQMLTSSANTKKQGNSWQTEDELFEKIQKFNK